MERDRFAMWSNLMIAHVWFAAGWIAGGWFPFAVGAVSLVLSGLSLYSEKIATANRQSP